MTLRCAAVAALVLLAQGCGGGSTPAASDANGVSTASARTSDRAASVAGKLATSLAPPSSVIVLEPEAAVELPINIEPAVMDQAGYEFLPGFLLAQAGQPVQFRNSEDVLHNVRVTEISTQKPVFNVATLAFGKYEHKFEPGYYDVTCDIHSTMRAGILVTASPYTAATAEDGSFSIAEVKPGFYKLTIYAGRTPVVRSVEVKSGRTDLGLIQ